MPGIFLNKGRNRDDQVADFDFMPNDAIAQMIVDAWVDQDLRNSLLSGDVQAREDAAKKSFAKYGFFWNGTTRKPVVITEAEYANDWELSTPEQLCFVLPNHDGTCPPGKNLLDTAKLLMAATPHGI